MTKAKRGFWRWLGFSLAGVLVLVALGLVWLIFLGGVALTDRAMLWQMIRGIDAEPPTSAQVTEQLIPADGFEITLWATGLPSARILLPLATGDVLLTQPRGGFVTLLEADRDGDGVSDVNIAEDLDGSLLYSNRLSAPLQGLELIYSVKRLPPGPGASVLGWVTVVLAMVLVGGFAILYRTGLSQISLARQQQDFVSAVSHELKSPLTSIRMYGEMLKEGWADESKRQSYYEYIHDEAERLTRLITNVLQLARITRNEPQFDRRPVNVGELMNVTESKIATQVERAGFALRMSTNQDAIAATVNVDTDCFVQMIINLVDNAIKFSRNAENRAIDIACQRLADNRIVFSVRDYGSGVAKDQMKKIFQLFYRSESELTRETVGTGIGLAIVHQLAVAMDGGVDMINASPGAEFRFWFPAVE